MRNARIALLFNAAALTLSLSLSTSAFAQNENGLTDQGEGLEEIVVTAQKRAQNLQQVPLAVTAFNTAQIESRNVAVIADLALVTPGLQFGGGNGTVTPFLRGVGNPAFAVGNESSVAVYTDGVYFTRLPEGFFSLNNIERVEVLKGPQGTLFGRNSSAGVIQIVTKDPSHTPGIKGGLSYGNYETIEGNFYVTTGLSEKIAADISVTGRSQNKGYGTNITTGNRANYNDNFTARSKILFEPGDTTSITLSGFYSYSKSGLQGNTWEGTTQGYVSPPAVQLPPLPGYYDQRSDKDLYSKAEVAGGSLRIVQDLSFAKLTSITAYSRERENAVFDADYVERPDFEVYLSAYVRQFTQELQLSGKENGAVEWIAGLFYYNTSSGYDQSEFRGPLLFGPAGFNAFSKQRAKSYAGYAQATVEVLPKLRLTGGLRYSRDEVSASGEGQIPGTPRFPFGSDSKTLNKLTFRMGANYSPTNNTLFYASFSRGYKSPSFNLLTYNGSVNKPEVLDAYEVGWKLDLLDRKVRFNGALFYYDIKDPQVQLITAGTIILTNAEAARVKGAEIDAQFAFTPALTGRLSATYLEPKYTKYTNATSGPPNPSPPYGAIAPFITIDASGRRLPYASKLTFTAGLDYKVDTGVGALLLSADYSHNDGFYFEPDNFLHQKKFGLLNAQARLSLNDKLSVRVWGKNLTDKEHAVLAATQTGSAGYPYIAAAPRTYGAGFDFEF